MKQKIKFKDLSGWLKLVAVMGFIDAAIIGAIIVWFSLGVWWGILLG